MKNCPLCGADADESAASCQCGYRFVSGRVDHATLDDGEAAASDNGGSWRIAGGLIATVSAGGLILSLVMDTAVGTIVNLDMMFTKGVAIASSLAGLGIGIFCSAVGAIISAIDRR